MLETQSGTRSLIPACGWLQRGSFWTYGCVALAAIATHAISFAASQLWVYPDSVDYIVLAAGIADRLDFTNELFLVRTPGYPLLLAVVFRLFGAASPTAILVMQHGMAVATAVLTATIGLHLSGRRSVALVSGLLCACSLQILAYTNLVLTETPYMLTLLLAIYAMIGFTVTERWRWLALASLLAGIGYLFRPVAMYLLPVCGALALWRIGTQHVSGARFSWRTLGLAAAACGGPAFIVAAPWMLLSAHSHQSLQATRCLDYVYYFRAATLEGLDSAQSPAMSDIHNVIAEARLAGHLKPDADFRDRAAVIQAYHAMRGLSFAQSSQILGQAGRELMREHPWSILTGTVRYAAWMLLSPDPVVRFQPGGSPGGLGKRDETAELFDVGTYAFGEGSWERTLRPVRTYLPLQTDPRPLTPLWKSVVLGFHRTIEQAPGILGIRDSLYEEFMLVIAAGALVSWFHSRRVVWVIVGSVLVLHVLVSAFLGGAQARYLAPVKPILCVYAASSVVFLCAGLATAVRTGLHALTGRTNPANAVLSGG